MGRLGFYFDIDTCIGCRTCQIACKDKNCLDVEVNFREVKTFQTGVFPEPRVFHYSGACNHCEDAKCVKSCPTGAMHYVADGTVQHDPELCIGCKYCTWNCPYGVPKYIEKLNISSKCDSCKTLRDAGENPVCVDACLMRCIHFGDIDELKAKYGPNLVKEIPTLPAAKITEPSLLIKPKACALDPKFKEWEV